MFHVNRRFNESMLRMPTRCVTDCGQRPIPEEDVGVVKDG